MSRLAKLLALANAPGTEHEGDAAKAAAAREAAREGLELVEGTADTLLAMDAMHADLMRALRRIADGTRNGGELDV